MRRLINIIVVAALAGCAAPTVKPLTTPDGKAGYLIKCDGSADDWATCYAEASKACNGQPYKVIDRNETSTPTNYGPIVRRHMIAECKQ